jgi:hypothetical protein
VRAVGHAAEPVPERLVDLAPGDEPAAVLGAHAGGSLELLAVGVGQVELGRILLPATTREQDGSRFGGNQTNKKRCRAGRQRGVVLSSEFLI